MIGYKLFLLLEKFLMLLPGSWRKSFFTSLGALGYLLSSRYRNVVFQNLDYAFDGKMSQEEKEAIAKYNFKNLALNMMHLMELRHMSKEELSKKISIQNIEAVEKVHAEGRAVIYVTAHYASWELGGAAIGAFIEPLAAVYKKLKNQTYQPWVLEARDAFGNKSIEKTNVVKHLIRFIKKRFAIGLLIDTNIKKRDGIEVEFLGKPITQTPTAAYLARKYDVAIIPVATRTDDDEHYTLMIFDELVVEKTDNEKADIQKAAQLQADWLSDLIRKEPKFWFWLHRRWKNDKPEIYKK